MKRDAITKALRARIASGEYPPGSRIPIREKLLDIFDASKGTLQAAVNTLVEEGFLEACGSKGMVVSSRPPHLFRMGMTLPGGDSGALDSIWPLYERTLSKLRASGSPFSFEVYRGIGGETDEDSWEKLREDIACRRIAGLLVNDPQRIPLASFKALRAGGLPAVLFSREDEYEGPKLSRCLHDWNKMLERVIERMKAKGRRRLAVLVNTDFRADQIEAFKRLVAASGLESRPEWFLASSLTRLSIGWTPSVVRAIFQGHGEGRPDCFLVLNENLASFAFDGLRSLGLLPGSDVDCVSHCNFPCSLPHIPGVERIGFDAKASLETAFSLLSGLVSGSAKPGTSYIEPIWESEYDRKTL